ncbi:hypothetical protein SAMN05421833_12990 [Microbispora rosea]|uniref:Uncharacterized protein n=1 Tax=Microbispora rosea TaxID=58117 RepID=A0A1N7GJ22_9ACTN|nr:hypothetical protein [Microbispora rosea]GIH51683.1 hypothetical protein Mro03_68620 [Microbispora rosea subsp. rosea]SIS12591.1 hypothetical protein SAMN05421833_12990 [Microbispora rosea]
MPGPDVDPQPERPGAVVLHISTAHDTFGWCARCPGRSEADELTAWRMHTVTPALAALVEEVARSGA